MKLREFWYLIKSDLYRYTGKISKYLLIRYLLLDPGFKYTFWMRLNRYLRQKSIFLYSIGIIAKLFLFHYRYKYGIDIHPSTQIGSGFYIGHFGCIVVNSDAIIGNNCNISHGVTIGVSNRGKRKGCPTIGNEVYIGPGAKIFGNINIGNNVAIGANCVVTRDIPNNAVVVGIPGEVISYNGSDGYIDRIDYENKALW
jgi:serine O-acetyltransferase